MLLFCLVGVFLAGNCVAANENYAAMFRAGKPLPEGLKIGTSTAAYQIEGAWNKDGRGPSIWDDFTHRFPEKIVDRSNGDIAANSYELYKEDIKLVKNLGMQFYRFSISWSRILPKGDLSSVNTAGIDYYNRVINHLLANGIEPMVTMYHYDLPQAFARFGGLTNSIVVDHFEAYADLLFKLYGDRVKYWITFNEPLAFCPSGYGNQGERPPGLAAHGVGEYLCMHNVIKAHAKAYRLYERKYLRTQQGKISITVDSKFAFPNPASNNTAEAGAEFVERYMQFQLGWVMHPILKGDYPPVMRQRIDYNSRREGRAFSRLPEFTADEVAEINGTADFFALNYYTSRLLAEITHDDIVKNNVSSPSWDLDLHLQPSVRAEWKHSQSWWLYSVPEGLGGILRWIKREYNNPETFITENGWSDDGKIDDTERIQYIHQHLAEIVKAIRDGCHITAYTVWSIIDNFEWTSGYTEKFGLHYVNYESEGRERTPKKSAEFMRNVNLFRSLPEL